MKKKWFKAKDYGWGWQPASWEGWMVLLVWTVVLVWSTTLVDWKAKAPDVSGFLITMFASIAALIAICVVTGERPEWRWGGKVVTAGHAWRETLYLLGSIVIAEGAGALGSVATFPNITSWYVQIHKPSWTPPNVVFGPVWTFLFLAMGVAAYIVWSKRKDGARVRPALMVYGAQLVLNVTWSVVFFALHQVGLAIIVIIALWVSILLTLIKFWRIHKVAGALLVPYLAWVSFATALNIAIFFLN